MNNPSSKHKPSVAIFDFDGTIADSMRQMVVAYNQVAADLKLIPITEDRVHALRKMGPREAMSAMDVSMWKLPRIMTAVRAQLRRSADSVEPFAGIPEALRELWLSGCKTAIVSSNSTENIRELLARHDLDRFDVLSCGASMFGKASRLRKLTQHARLAGGRFFYVGDEIRDVTAAREAGIASVSVTWGYAELSALQAQNPQHIAHTPADLVAILTRTS